MVTGKSRLTRSEHAKAPFLLCGDQSGNINILIFPLIAAVLLLIGAASFGYWAFSGRQDYKNNVDQKIAVASSNAVKVAEAKKDAQFAEQAKFPLKPYDGPSNYGSVHVLYPKTWSAYVDDTNNGSSVLNAYFYPDYVPTVTQSGNAYALRVQIVNQPYSGTLRQYSEGARGRAVTASPYTLPKMKSIVGTRFDGAISVSKKGTLIMLPLRDKTLQLSTEATQFSNDFEKNVLPSVTFSP